MTCAKSSWYTLNSGRSACVVCVVHSPPSLFFMTGRQASQLLTHFKEIFENGLLPLFLYPYALLPPASRKSSLAVERSLSSVSVGVVRA